MCSYVIADGGKSKYQLIPLFIFQLCFQSDGYIFCEGRDDNDVINKKERCNFRLNVLFIQLDVRYPLNDRMIDKVFIIYTYFK